jgi:Resolvase, N terminal domain
LEATVSGQRIGYVRVSTLDQNEKRQLEGQVLDRVFTDKASGRDTSRPQLTELLRFASDGDIVVVHSMGRLARNLDDLRVLVQGLTRKGVRVEFVKESLVFTGEDSPMANLMLSVMGAYAEFERSLIRAKRKASPSPSNAAPTKDGKRLSHPNVRPIWSSGQAAVFRKLSLPVTTGSAGRPSTSICATPSWAESLPCRRGHDAEPKRR